MAVATSRKWLITINNPIEHGFDHARIKAAILDLPNVLYWCMCDEQGDECETLHTHVYLVALNAHHRASQDVYRSGQQPNGGGSAPGAGR